MPPTHESKPDKLPTSRFPVRSDNWYNEVLCKVFGYAELRSHQLRGIRSLCDGKDVFAIAPTGAGKSTYILGPAIADLIAGKECITLTIVPTKTLADEQAKAATRTGVLRGLALHEDSLSAANCGSPRRDLYKEIERGDWTHVYLGPEMITGSAFDDLLRSKQFRKKFRYFAIDEAHLVLEWKDFREKFLRIKQLRSRFPMSVAWLGLTATVEPTVEFPLLLDNLGFSRAATDIIRLPVDRRSIALAPRFLQHATSDTEFLDLSWVVPTSAKRLEDIPITVVFVDELQQVADLTAYLKRLLPTSIKKSAREHVVGQISGILTAEANAGVVQDLRAGNQTRIVVCTDAGALGIDVAQVERVAILFGKKSTSYKMICQKIGRIRTKGLVVILFPRWMNTSRTSTTDINQRAEVEQVIVEFANATVDRCPREINANFWGDMYEPLVASDGPCCNRHNRELDSEQLQDVQRRAGESMAKAKAKSQNNRIAIRSDGTHPVPDPSVMQPLARQAIDRWRLVNIQRVNGYKPHMPLSVLLPDHLAGLLAKQLHLCTTFERFKDVMSSWSKLNEWGPSLFDLVTDIWASFKSEPIAGMISNAQEARKAAKEKVRGEENVSQSRPQTSHVQSNSVSSRSKPNQVKSTMAGRKRKLP